MTDPAERERPPVSRRPQAPGGHAATGARILVGGLAVGAGLAMVGAMAAAAQDADPDTPVGAPDTVRRVVVVDEAPREIVVVIDGEVAGTVAAPTETPASPSPHQAGVPVPQTQSGGS